MSVAFCVQQRNIFSILDLKVYTKVSNIKLRKETANEQKFLIFLERRFSEVEEFAWESHQLSLWAVDSMTDQFFTSPTVNAQYWFRFYLLSSARNFSEKRARMKQTRVLLIPLIKHVRFIVINEYACFATIFEIFTSAQQVTSPKSANKHVKWLSSPT